MRFIVYPYKMGSLSAKLLARSLGGHRVRHNGRYRYRRGDKIVNFGNSRNPQWITNEAARNMLNKPHNVRNAANKLDCFRSLYAAEIPTVPFTTSNAVARNWNSPLYARHRLTGHSGQGITYVGARQEFAPAPLYTKAIENEGEYRVHVFGGRVIEYRKKVRRNGDEPQRNEERVRTRGNGWVYRRTDLRRIPSVCQLALDAIEALGLDFGAVDIIKDPHNNLYVLEVNTAVGMDDHTLSVYSNAIEDYYA